MITNGFGSTIGFLFFPANHMSQHDRTKNQLTVEKDEISVVKRK
jgi:hypothetical protein